MSPNTVPLDTGPKTTGGRVDSLLRSARARRKLICDSPRGQEGGELLRKVGQAIRAVTPVFDGLWRTHHLFGRAGAIAFESGSATSALYLPLEGGGRRPSRSEGRRVGVTAEQQTQCPLLSPHPGSLREPTLPLQGRVAQSSRRRRYGSSEADPPFVWTPIAPSRWVRREGAP